MNLRARLWNFAIAEDRALVALGGGKLDETLSGTTGRAMAKHSWWAKIAVEIIDGIFGLGHCAEQAAIEAKQRIAEAKAAADTTQL